MQSQNYTTNSIPKWQQQYLQTNNLLSQYLKNRTNLQCWNNIFWLLNTSLGKQGPLSTQSQKYINFYLQNKAQGSQLGNLIIQNKQIICKVYDLALTIGENVDQAISTGGLYQAIVKKFQKDQSFTIGALKVIGFYVEAVAIHFCQFIKKFKQVNGSHVLPINRKISKIIKRKNLSYTCSQQFAKQCFNQPVFMLDNFMDNVKPIIINYLNMQSLFEITSPYFKNKKALLTGCLSNSQFIGKIVNLNTIFDSTYTGREMIQTKLNQLTLSQNKLQNVNNNQYWSLTTCLSQLQPQIHSIIQKLPLFLRPKCNGDILSFCRYQMFPIYKYQVIKAGYIEKPMISQYFTVFMNVGKCSFDLLCFPQTGNISNQLIKYQKQNLLQNIDKLSVRYSKVRVSPKSLAVVPNNNYYILSTDLIPKNTKTLTQIIFWNILPKDPQSIKKSLQTIQTKKKLLTNYYFLPIQQILLDYLNHQYIKIYNQSVLKQTRQYINTQINKQQQKVITILKTNQKISIQSQYIDCNQRFCSFCKFGIINYYCKTTKRQYICMECSINTRGIVTQKVFYIYNPNDIRYPLILTKIFIETRKHPNQSIQNRYQKNVCCGQFIGSIDNQYCRGQQLLQQGKTIDHHPLNLYKKDQLFFINRLKQLKIVSVQEILTGIALMEPQMSQRSGLLERIKMLVKQIQDPDNFIKTICSKLEKNNLVTDVIWAFRIQANPELLFN